MNGKIIFEINIWKVYL